MTQRRRILSLLNDLGKPKANLSVLHEIGVTP
jgi:hypothetical protein